MMKIIVKHNSLTHSTVCWI